MKLGKIINGEMSLVECENGIEVNGTRSEESLLEEGYKPVCEIETDGEPVYEDYGTCFIQVAAPSDNGEERSSDSDI